MAPTLIKFDPAAPATCLKISIETLFTNHIRDSTCDFPIFYIHLLDRLRRSNQGVLHIKGSKWEQIIIFTSYNWLMHYSMQ